MSSQARRPFSGAPLALTFFITLITISHFLHPTLAAPTTPNTTFSISNSDEDIFQLLNLTSSSHHLSSGAISCTIPYPGAPEIDRKACVQGLVQPLTLRPDYATPQTWSFSPRLHPKRLLPRDGEWGVYSLPADYERGLRGCKIRVIAGNEAELRASGNRTGVEGGRGGGGGGGVQLPDHVGVFTIKDLVMLVIDILTTCVPVNPTPETPWRNGGMTSVWSPAGVPGERVVPGFGVAVGPNDGLGTGVEEGDELGLESQITTL